MKKMKIQLTCADDIVDFVNWSMKVNGDVIVHRGSMDIDGTSLMGMFALNITEPIEVSFPKKAIKFKKFLSKFEL